MEKTYHVCTVCPRSPGQFYIVNYYFKWDKTSWNCIMHINFFIGSLERPAGNHVIKCLKEIKLTIFLPWDSVTPTLRDRIICFVQCFPFIPSACEHRMINLVIHLPWAHRNINLKRSNHLFCPGISFISSACEHKRRNLVIHLPCAQRNINLKRLNYLFCAVHTKRVRV